MRLHREIGKAPRGTVARLCLDLQISDIMQEQQQQQQQLMESSRCHRQSFVYPSLPADALLITLDPIDLNAVLIALFVALRLPVRKEENALIAMILLVAA